MPSSKGPTDNRREAAKERMAQAIRSGDDATVTAMIREANDPRPMTPDPLAALPLSAEEEAELRLRWASADPRVPPGDVRRLLATLDAVRDDLDHEQALNVEQEAELEAAHKAKQEAEETLATLDRERGVTVRKAEPIGSDPDNEVDAGDWFDRERDVTVGDGLREAPWDLATLLPYIRHGATCALQAVRDNAPTDELCTCGLREAWHDALRAALQPWREASRRLIANGDDDEGSAA